MTSKGAVTVVQVWMRVVAMWMVRHGHIPGVQKGDLKGFAIRNPCERQKSNRKNSRAIFWHG